MSHESLMPEWRYAGDSATGASSLNHPANGAPRALRWRAALRGVLGWPVSSAGWTHVLCKVSQWNSAPGHQVLTTEQLVHIDPSVVAIASRLADPSHAVPHDLVLAGLLRAADTRDVLEHREVVSVLVGPPVRPFAHRQLCQALDRVRIEPDPRLLEELPDGRGPSAGLEVRAVAAAELPLDNSSGRTDGVRFRDLLAASMDKNPRGGATGAAKHVDAARAENLEFFFFAILQAADTMPVLVPLLQAPTPEESCGP
eukprot:CAMPEP_0179105684 /NCGR_PEP_ID=MMETSP0796-20121207/49094_1 /TAXON_ID=73915 /ORGANISM="Pyrodinium bahamense, Strain pbaha01" /LENGTH=255 /DNA_ID=CAMNT_0020803677 /DNA_START=50 /DNA_END=818 /DNA_ORIENTATION=+